MAARIASLSAVVAITVFAALSASPAAPIAAQETIPVGDTWFCEPQWQDAVCPATIPVGETIVWDFSGASLTHTVTDCGASCDSPTSSPAFDSGPTSGGTFSHTFDTAGTFLYHCEVHPAEMRGQIFVLGADTPGAPSPIAPTIISVTPSATPTTGALPSTGSGGSSSDGTGWAIAGVSAIALAAVLVGTALVLRARRVEP